MFLTMVHKYVLQKILPAMNIKVKAHEETTGCLSSFIINNTYLVTGALSLSLSLSLSLHCIFLSLFFSLIVLTTNLRFFSLFICLIKFSNLHVKYVDRHYMAEIYCRYGVKHYSINQSIMLYLYIPRHVNDNNNSTSSRIMKSVYISQETWMPTVT